MFEKINSELKSLILPMDFLTTKQAEKIIDQIFVRLQEEIENLIIFDVLNASPSSNPKFPSLEVLISNTENCKRGKSKRQYTNDNGLWSVSFKERKSVLINNVKDKKLIKCKREEEGEGYIKLTEPIKNEMNQKDFLMPEDLIIWGETNAIIVIPLIFTNVKLGIFSLEISEGILNRDLCSDLEEIVYWIAVLLWKIDVDNKLKEGTESAIERFGKTEFENRSPDRRGFIGRPFVDDSEGNIYEQVESMINDVLAEDGAKAYRFDETPGSENSLLELKKQIELAHFGIFDITGHRPNVMFELGMFKFTKKSCIILQKKEDKDEIGIFGLQDSFRRRYQFEKEELAVNEPGSIKSVKIKSILKKFIKNLEKEDKYFTNAKRITEA